MRPDPQDASFLWDMLKAARGIVEMTNGMEYADYLADRKTQLAVERQVEIIGEAARRVSESLRAANAEIPWQRIIAQRHVLAHEYGVIRQDLMWRVVSVHIPELISLLEPLIPPSPQSP